MDLYQDTDVPLLKIGEEDVPGALKEAMAVGNRWQDLLTGSFTQGRTGNEILAETRRLAEAEGTTLAGLTSCWRPATSPTRWPCVRRATISSPLAEL